MDLYVLQKVLAEFKKEILKMKSKIKICLLIIVVTDCVCAGFEVPTAPFEIDDDTLALFHFDENTGTVTYGASPTDPCEFIGNFRNSYSGAASWVSTADLGPDFNYALEYPGWEAPIIGVQVDNVNNEIGLVDIPGTIECRLKLNEVPDANYSWRSQIAIAGPYAAGNAWGLEIQGGGKVFYNFTDNLNDGRVWHHFLSQAAIGLDQWHHIAVTRNITPPDVNGLRDVTVCLYIDGQLDTRETYEIYGIIVDYSTPLRFGHHDTNMTHKLNGTIEEFRISKNIRYGTCEDGFKNPADINEDCKINFEDFTILAENWMSCNSAEDANCLEFLLLGD